MQGEDRKTVVLTALQAALRDGDLAGARAAAASLVELKPESHKYWGLLADIAAQCGDMPAALAAIRRARSLSPDEPVLAAMAAELHLMGGDRAGAIASAASLAPSALDGPRADRVGTVLTHAGDPTTAIPFFERALASAPDNIGYRFNLATAQQMVGQGDKAEENLDRMLAVAPHDGQAQLVRSSLRQQTVEANHIAELETALARADEGLNRVTIRFALAKELEDLGRDEECFAQLAAANGWVRGAMDFDVAADVAVLDALGRGPPMPTRIPHDKGEAAIFVIGLPRSGTTLVERILASHPDVTAGGETGAFASLVVAADRALEGGAPADRLDFVRRAERLDEEHLGERYLDMLRGQIGTPPRFSDKTPDNYLYAGLISRALPGSRFILLERYPMDSCYAMFKTLFNQAYPFSYDLDDLARYYVAWRDLMGRWKERLGSSMLTVSYESLVRNQESESRRILAHCGLEWDERVLAFHKLGAPVSTASAAQVRRPIYDSSVGLWRRFEQQLQPLSDRLAAAGIDMSDR